MNFFEHFIAIKGEPMVQDFSHYFLTFLNFTILNKVDYHQVIFRFTSG